MKKAKKKPQDLTTRNAKAYNKRLLVLECRTKYLLAQIDKLEQLFESKIRIGEKVFVWKGKSKKEG